MSTGTAVAAVRLVHDAWSQKNDVHLLLLQRMLDEAESEELRDTTEDLAILVVGLATLFDEAHPEWDFDEWLAGHALHAAGQAAS